MRFSLISRGFCLALLLLLPTLGRANAARAGGVCDDWVLSLSEGVRTLGLLDIEPGGQRFLLGSLIQTDRGPLLALGGYSNRHQAIHEVFEFLKEDGVFDEYEYEWQGEMRWVNHRQTPGHGSLVEANEVAGHFAEVVNPKGLGKNSVGRLMSRLKAFDKQLKSRRPKRQRLLWPSRLKIPFERSLRAQSFHLMPGLDEYIGVIEELKRFEYVGPDENYRHYLPCKVTSLFAALEAIVYNYSGEYLTDREKTDALHHAFQFRLGRESLQLLLKTMHNDGMWSETTAALNYRMQTLTVRPLVLNEWEELLQLKEAFEPAFLRYFDSEFRVGKVELYWLDG